MILPLIFLTCKEPKGKNSIDPENWEKRMVDIDPKDSLEYGKTYLSIYSQIYSINQEKKHNLTVLVSMRNTSDLDTIYVLNAKYYDTHGKTVRAYFDHPIYLAPMETIEIIIDEIDVTGGTGSNFTFEWKVPEGCTEPLFEGVMNSTMGQQGLSFITQGVRIL